jgi:hypothetical protein
VIGFLHFGHGPVRPANWSLTVKVALQDPHSTWIAMISPESKTCRPGHSKIDHPPAPAQTTARRDGQRPAGKCQRLPVCRQVMRCRDGGW